MEIRKIKRNKPRIALIGEQVYTAKLAVALATKYGYEVDVLTRADDEQKEIENTSAIRIKKFGRKSHPWNLPLHLGTIAWVFFYLLSQGKSYRIYHAHSASTAFAMKAASWLTRVPTLLTVHSNHVFDKSWTLRKILDRVMFLETKYSKEVSISECFLKAVNVNENIQVVPYGIRTEPFDAVDSARSPNQFNVLYVGRLSREKGVDVLLKAWEGLRDIPLKIMGDGPLATELKNYAQKKNIHQIEFLGYLSQEGYHAYMKGAGFIVVPSVCYENFPRIIAEAYAYGVPVLASRLGTLPELVRGKETGLMFVSGNPCDLAQKARWLWTQDEDRERMNRIARQQYEKEYAAEKNYTLLMNIYKRTIEMYRASR